MNKVLSEYRKINESYEEKVIFHLTYRGFFSELNNMALAVLYCLVNKKQFVLFSKKWIASYSGRGWSDYFVDFCPKRTSFIFYRKRAFPVGIWDRLRSSAFALFFPKVKTSHEVWGELWKPKFIDRRFYFPELGIDGDIYEAKRAVFLHIFKLKFDLKRLLVHELNALNIRKYEYIGVHIRRGDKVAGAHKEAELVELNEYEQVLKRFPELRHIFITSDEFNSVLALRDMFPEHNIVTYAESDRRGFIEAEFMKKGALERKKEVVDLLRDVNALIYSKIFIGTYSSNIGLVVGNLRGRDKVSISMQAEWRAY